MSHKHIKDISIFVLGLGIISGFFLLFVINIFSFILYVNEYYSMVATFIIFYLSFDWIKNNFSIENTNLEYFLSNEYKNIYLMFFGLLSIILMIINLPTYISISFGLSFLIHIISIFCFLTIYTDKIQTLLKS